MNGKMLRVRDRDTGALSAALRLVRPYRMTDVDDDSLVTDAEAGAILIFSPVRHPEWPESKIVDDMFQPHEMGKFAAIYEVIEER